MRVLLVTGLGGAGRSTVAAGVAVRAAGELGLRTLLLSADRSHGLSAALDHPVPAISPALSPAPTAQVAPGLHAARIDFAAHFRDQAADLQRRAGPALTAFGVTPLDAEELTELPGHDSLVLLRAIRDHASGQSRYLPPGGGPAIDFDLLVVDCPPVAETLSMLALPEQLRRYLSRLLPAERQAARALRPLLATLAGVPMPAEWLYSAAAWAEAELAAAQRFVQSPDTTFLLVVEAGAEAAEAVRGARAGLALYGHRLAAVVANRLVPSGSSDPWLAELSARQRESLETLRAECSAAGGGVPRSVPVYPVPHLGRPPRGIADLGFLAVPGEVLAAGRIPSPRGRANDPWMVTDRIAEDGELVWSLPLPGAHRADLDLIRRGDELVIDVGPYRRIVMLPSALRRCTVSGAALRAGTLRVRFAPDPALWPRSGNVKTAPSDPALIDPAHPAGADHHE